MNRECKCPGAGEPCSHILPKGVDLCIDHNVCKVRADVTVDRVRSVLIWGSVTDCNEAPVSGALVKLMKYTDCDDLQEICRTYTDCRGQYQFDLENGCAGRYRVLVSQSTCQETCSPPCHTPCHNPCEEPCPSGSCRYVGGESRGCRSVSRSNVQYY